MALDWFGSAGGGASGLSSGISGIGSGLGSLASAKGSKQSAAALNEAARLTLIGGKLKARGLSRDIYKTLGGAEADVASNGLETGGSALDSIRSSATEGALAKAVQAINTKTEYTSLIGQAQAAAAEGKAKKKSGIGSIIGGVVQAGAAVAFSDPRLKTDIELIHRREDGIGVYTFRYLPDGHKYLGVMADEVEKIRPDAVYEEDGYLKVAYDLIHADFRRLS